MDARKIIQNKINHLYKEIRKENEYPITQKKEELLYFHKNNSFQYLAQLELLEEILDEIDHLEE